MATDIVSTGNDLLTAVGNAISYTVGNCTRWVAEQLSWVPGGWGDAAMWFSHAQQQGFQTVGPNAVPPAGSIAVWDSSLPGSGGAGHVAEVISATASSFTVSEENWLGLGKTDVRTITSSSPDFGHLVGFILPPAGFQVPNPLGGLAGAAQAAVTTPQAIAGLPASIGHGIANAGGALVQNAGIALRNQLVPLLVALAVAIVLFGGDDRQQ